VTLHCSPDSLKFLQNQINVPISDMSDVLHSLGAKYLDFILCDEVRDFECKAHD
jgi:hypothetical protein